MVVVDELLIKVKADTAQAERQMSGFVNSIKQTLRGIGSAMTQMGQTLTTRVTLPIVGAGVAIVKLASDAAEAASKFNTVFGDMGADIMATFGNDIPRAMGISTAEFQDMAGTMGSISIAMGATKEQAADLTSEWSIMAADLGSFHNIPIPEALNAIKSGLVGEFEPLKRFGVLINVARVEAKALEMGLYDGEGALSDYAKQVATTALIEEQMGAATGDFARTSDGLANSMRILKGQLADAGAQLGQVLLPYVQQAVDLFSTWVDKFVELSPEMQELIVKIGGLAAVAGPTLIILGQVVKAISILSGPIGLAVLAVGALAFAAHSMGLKWEDVVSWFQNVLQPVVTQVFGQVQVVIQEVMEFITTWITDHMDEIQAVFDAAIKFVLAVWDELVRVLGPLVEDIMSFINDEVGELVAWFEEIWPVLSETVLDVLGIIQHVWERIWPIIEKYIMPIWENIKSIISGALDVIKGVIKFVLNLIQGNWGEAWEGMLQALSGVWSIIEGVVGGAVNAVKLAIELAIAGIKTAWDDMWTFMKDGVASAWRGIKGLAVGGINAFLRTLESFINKVIGGINSLIDKVNAIPGVGFNHIGRVSLPRVSVAEGGMALGRGVIRARVGERGPEEVLLPAGSSVSPTGGSGGPLIGNLYTLSKDARGIAEEVGWELLKSGAGR